MDIFYNKNTILFLNIIIVNLLKISIIIPVYNVEPYITECLQSVMRQTYTGQMECLVIDDCGTDKSIEIAERLISDYKGSIEFKILHHEHNRGLSAARNTGMKAATGDYVYFLDSDDYVSDDCMEVLARPLQEKQYDIVVGNFCSFGGETNVGLWVDGGELWGEKLRKACFRLLIYPMAWGKLYNFLFIQHHCLSFYEGIIHEDMLWNYRVINNLKLVYVEKKCTMYYRIHSQGIMGYVKKNPQRAADSWYLIIKQIIDQEHKDNNDYEQERIYYINFLFQQYLMCDYGNKARMKELYLYIRKHWNYNPLRLYIKGLMSIRQVKKQLCYVLPYEIGWWHLYLSLKKHYNLN